MRRRGSCPGGWLRRLATEAAERSSGHRCARRRAWHLACLGCNRQLPPQGGGATRRARRPEAAEARPRKSRREAAGRLRGEAAGCGLPRARFDDGISRSATQTGPRRPPPPQAISRRGGGVGSGSRRDPAASGTRLLGTAWRRDQARSGSTGEAAGRLRGVACRELDSMMESAGLRRRPDLVGLHLRMPSHAAGSSNPDRVAIRLLPARDSSARRGGCRRSLLTDPLPIIRN